MRKKISLVLMLVMGMMFFVNLSAIGFAETTSEQMTRLTITVPESHETKETPELKPTKTNLIKKQRKATQKIAPLPAMGEKQRVMPIIIGSCFIGVAGIGWWRQRKSVK